jgi:uncharacterized protein DUF4384
MTNAVLIALMLTVPATVFAQSQTLSEGPYRIQITLERYSARGWQGVDSRLVLDQDDTVRFRMRTNFSGFLYVTNLSTSGRYDQLFPGSETGGDNKIEAGKDYLIPASEQGSFRVTGPPGQEIVYWLISPGPIDNRTATPTQPPRKPPTLIPRCDDTILRARGDCVDTTAGPKQVQETNALPADLAVFPNVQSRELVFMQLDKSSVVSSPASLKGPAIYEFRLSHK